MKLRTLIAAGAALGALAAPAAAEAHRNPDHRDVRSHVRTADRSLDRVVRLVGAGNLSQVTGELAKHRRHARAALKDARGVLRSADTTRELRRAAFAYRSVASQQGVDVAQYTQLLGSDVTGSLQTRVARLLNASLSEREDVLDQLTALLDELPAGSQVGVSRWIRQLTGDSQAQVGSILGLLTQASFAPNVQELMGRALELATAAMEEAMSRLDAIVGMLPAQAREPVRQALGQVETTIAMVRGMLEALVGSLPAVTPGQVPALPDFGSLLPGLSSVLPGLGGTLPDPSQLLGNLTNVLPALQGLIPNLGGGLPVGGQLPAAGDILEQVGQLVPGLSELLAGLVGGIGVPGTGGETGGGTGGDSPLGGVQQTIEGLLGGLLGGLL